MLAADMPHWRLKHTLEKKFGLTITRETYNVGLDGTL